MTIFFVMMIIISINNNQQQQDQTNNQKKKKSNKRRIEFENRQITIEPCQPLKAASKIYWLFVTIANIIIVYYGPFASQNILDALQRNSIVNKSITIYHIYYLKP